MDDKLYIFVKNVDGLLHRVMIPHSHDDLIWHCLKEIHKLDSIDKCDKIKIHEQALTL